MATRDAACSCGQLRLEADGDPIRISVCHCLACQRRTGSAFGVAGAVPGGTSARHRPPHRVRAALRRRRRGAAVPLLPGCGGTVFYTTGDAPDLIAVPVGAFADPSFPPPTVSVYESRRHPWVALPDAIEPDEAGRRSARSTRRASTRRPPTARASWSRRIRSIRDLALQRRVLREPRRADGRRDRPPAACDRALRGAARAGGRATRTSTRSVTSRRSGSWWVEPVIDREAPAAAASCAWRRMAIRSRSRCATASPASGGREARSASRRGSRRIRCGHRRHTDYARDRRTRPTSKDHVFHFCPDCGSTVFYTEPDSRTSSWSWSGRSPIRRSRRRPSGVRIRVTRGSSFRQRSRATQVWEALRPLDEDGEQQRCRPSAANRSTASGNAQLLYNDACGEGLAGRTAETISTGVAIDFHSDLGPLAAGDSDLDAIRDEPAFRALVG